MEKMVLVESSNIESIGWENNQLYVSFKTGKTYKYEDVPEIIYQEMLNSESKGRYLNNNIKPNYSCSRV